MHAPTTDRSNESWVRTLQANDADALRELRAYLVRGLDRVLRGRAGQSDVEDFAQLALERILARLESFRGDSAFTTWASAIATRVAFTELRRKQWGSVSLDAVLNQGAAGESMTASAADGATTSAQTEILSALRDGIHEALTERQRLVVIAELEQVPTVMLSEQTGMKPGALYKMHHDARKRLRQYLEDRGFDLEDVRFALHGASNE
jgi:RNA polymerase sigma-70 factor (ECF subfamily)